MKILFNCLNFNKGGAERVLSILANNMSKKHEVVIITIMNSEDKYEINNKIKRYYIDNKNYLKKSKIIKMMMKLSPRRLYKLYRIVVREKPDVIISFLPEPSLRLALLKKMSRKIRKIPLIISIRNDPQIEYQNYILKIITKFLYKKVDCFVLQTEDARFFFQKMLNRNKNMFVVQNPISETFNTTDIKKRNISKNTVVSVGRLENAKNHRLLINAFCNILKKHPNYNLDIYGDGSLKKELQDYIVELNMTEYIHLKGQVDDIQNRISNSFAFVLSSNYEGMSNALIEAMCMGVPCISSRVSGSKDIIKDQINGLLFDIGNQKQLENCISKLIENNKLREKISKNSRLLYNNVNENKIIGMWYEVIAQITKKVDS